VVQNTEVELLNAWDIDSFLCLELMEHEVFEHQVLFSAKFMHHSLTVFSKYLVSFLKISNVLFLSYLSSLLLTFPFCSKISFHINCNIFHFFKGCNVPFS
jgi:hypothetical protein